MQQHAQQRIAIALAAGEYADALENILAGKQEATQQAAKLSFAGLRRNPAQVIQNARILVELLVLILGEIVGLNVVAQLVFSLGEVFFVGQQLDERGLAGAIYSH